MCGRYYVDDEVIADIRRIVKFVDERIHLMPKGERCPTQAAPIIFNRNQEFAAELCPWGFPNFTGKGVIFNARSESAMEKKLFRESVRRRRCVIPVSGFYEWDKAKNRYTFTRDDGSVMYLAGFYNIYDGQDRFVILTTEANESMEGIHDRMPLVLEQDELQDWLFDDERAEYILRQKPVTLRVGTEFIQETLKFD